MADIEDRAEKWAREKLAQERALSSTQDIHPWLVAAYLAGSAQTQADYAAPVPPITGTPCERHGLIGCAWCIPGPYDECPRCVCTCGAR